MLHCMLSTTCKVTTEAALGLIGGTMGLLTGFSILSGVEIIYYLLRFYVRMNQCFILLHHSYCNCLTFLHIIYSSSLHTCALNKLLSTLKFSLQVLYVPEDPQG